MKIWNPFAPKPRRKTRAASAPSFHAVKIRFSGKSACNAVRALAGKIYLSAEAPRLPVTGCSHQGSCECRYFHMEDRRSGPRRDADIGLPTRAMPVERRQRIDRRIAAAV